MKFTKITSLILAILMVLAVFPFTLLTAGAATAAPSTLPDGSSYETSQMTANAAFSIPASLAYNKWNNVFVSGFDAFVIAADGIMFKFDTTNVTDNADTPEKNRLRVGFEFNIKSADGSKRAYLCSSARRAAAHNTSNQIVPDGATSIWYVSTDGQNWTEIVDTFSASDNLSAGHLTTVTEEKTVGYVYIPFSSMYYNKDNNGDGKADTFAETVAIYGEDFKFDNFCPRCENVYANDPTTSLSEFQFVFKNGKPSLVPTGVDKAPTTLPTGEAYTGVAAYASTFDVMTAYKNRINKTNSYDQTGWPAELTADATQAVKNGAKGVMIRIDTSDATCNSDILSMSFALQVMFNKEGGSYKSNTYAVATAKLASAFGEAKYIDGTKSTWYYSKDGESWNAISTAASQMEIPAGKGYTYVYIPLDAFWFKTGITHLSGGSLDKTENIVPWSEGVALWGDDWKFQLTNHYFAGNGTTNVTLAQDPSTVISNWTFVIPGEGGGSSAEHSKVPPTKLPDGETYIAEDFFVPSFDVMSVYQNRIATNGAYDQAGWQGSTILTSKATDLVKNGAEGIMFKIDTSKATCMSDILNMTFAIQVRWGDYDTYILATAKQAANFAEAKYYDGASSTWYYSQDGKNWNSLTTTTESQMSLPIGKGLTYVYVPMDAFYTKCGETRLKTGVHNKEENIVPWSEAVKLLPADWYFAMTNFYFQGNGTSNIMLAQDAQTKIMNWQAVTHGTPAIVVPGGAANAPSTLPDGETYVKENFFSPAFDVMTTYQSYIANKNAYDQIGWQGNVMASNAVQAIKDGAEGIMFKIDTSKATCTSDLLSMSFAIQTFFGTPDAAGKYPYNTYILATAKLASDFAEAKYKDGASSTWYYSQNGQTWSALESGSNSRMSMSVGKAITYVFIPMDAFYAKCGETFLKTGAHAHTNGGEKEYIVNWNDALKIVGDNWSFGMANFYFGGNGTTNVTLAQDITTKIVDWKVVTHGVPTENPGYAENPPATLPGSADPYKIEVVDPNFSIPGNLNINNIEGQKTSWDGYWCASDKDVPNGHIDLKSVGSTFQAASGFMFKFDTRNAAEGYDALSMTVELAITAPTTGKSTYFLADPKFSTAYGGKLTVNATSTWYYSIDGVTWKSVTKSSSVDGGMPITSERTMGYIYIPMDQFWTKGFADDNTVMRATEALAVMGGDAYFSNMKIRLKKTGVSCDPNTLISEFAFVYSAYNMTRETVSVTDSLAWNVFVSVPANYTESKLVFTLGDRVVEAKPDKQDNGLYKYTLEGISYADVTKPIQAKWTAKDANGKLVTETYDTTLEAYFRKVMSDSKYTNMMKALLHYAAALQTANGETGKLANDGVEEVAHVDLARLKFLTYENNYPTLWGTPTLVVKDGYTQIKIPVNAPDGFTHVRYEPDKGGRLSTTEIIDGYAYIPVYAHESRVIFTLTFYKKGTVDKSSSIQISFNYVVFEAAKNEADVAVLQAMMDYCDAARKLMKF